MAADDRLSVLSDDLLRRILHFVPSREAASTSLLSRRWGSLWRSTGTVNLAVRVVYDDVSGDDEAFSSRRDAFVRASQAALAAAAAGAGVTRLTLNVAGRCLSGVDKFLNYGGGGGGEEIGIVDAVVSHPAARHVEELRVGVAGPMYRTDGAEQRPWQEARRWRSDDIYTYTLSFASLPSATLRVLDITECNFSDSKLALPDAGVAFPRLDTLRLRLCAVRLAHLQRLIDAAPALATVHLEYTGHPRRFYLESPAPEMTAVNIHFIDGDHRFADRLWRFLGNFTNVKILKLTVQELGHLAVAGKARRAELLCKFGNLERLELEAVRKPTKTKAPAPPPAVAIANLLHCCPALVDLSLKLKMLNYAWSKNNSMYLSSFHAKFKPDFDKSVGLFMRHKSKMTAVSSSLIDEHHDDKFSNISGLSGKSFACLNRSLRRVNLQFQLGSASNCFGVRLIRFFAQNAMVLEEMCIDSGNRKLCEHMNLNVERWVGVDSSKIRLKDKNLTGSSWEFSRIHPDSAPEFERNATSFKVLPLERR
ncbi:Os11g0641900 [Oryza sativa Japonica Group]|uniref:Os11g0641900 protein n=1 Tax=Oryza sativa subsp. japonica TaxID=39947 RepID=A0A0P0Y4Q1_ORYSJ|nr:Os11g0641900 [Oryza sativa Japonica Group]